MSEDQRDLVKCVRKYREYDEKRREYNSQLSKLREEMKIIELEMGDILKRSHYSHIFKLDISDDNSAIRIQRPEQWSKPWSLSIKDLTTYVTEFFANQTHPKTPAACVSYIVDRRRKDLVSTDFSFSRITQDKDTENA
jgi:hypothetical protein